MFRYAAPNPYSAMSFDSWSGFISASITIGQMVLPAQLREPIVLSVETLGSLAELNQVIIQDGCICTYDGAELDSIEIKPQDEASKPPCEQYYIVKFNGNRLQYQHSVSHYAHDANRMKVTVVGFNYRGVGNSTQTPITFQQLVTDGIAQVQRLLDNGVDSKKMTLDGLSLGGGVATMVADHFHNIGKPVYLWNDRSFAFLSKAAAGMVTPEFHGMFGDIWGISLETSFWSVMALAGWDADVVKAYNSIPAQYKAHMYVAKRSENSSGDGVIAHRASLHKGVKSYENEQSIKTGHKVYAPLGLFGCGHNMKRRDLVSVEGRDVSGQTVFEAFIRNRRG